MPAHKVSPRSSPEALFQRTCWICCFFIIIYSSIFSGQGEAQTSSWRWTMRPRQTPQMPSPVLVPVTRPFNGRPLLNISVVRGEARIDERASSLSRPPVRVSHTAGVHSYQNLPVPEHIPSKPMVRNSFERINDDLEL